MTNPESETPTPPDPPAAPIPVTETTDRFLARFPYYYAAGMTFFTCLYLFWASFVHNFKVNDPSTRIIDTVTGFLLGVVISALVQFLFGSSLGSKRNGEAVRQAAQKAIGNPPPVEPTHPTPPAERQTISR